MQVQIKRVYDTPSTSDGLRVLVDRLWPRGLKKEDARIDVWAKQLAPSSELRKWFAHKDERFAEFARCYRTELSRASTEIDKLLSSTGDGKMTLLYAARNATSNHAIVLREWITHHCKSRTKV